MNEEFRKRFPVVPGFDCIKMKHDIQAGIHEATKGMTQAQRLDYCRSGAKKLRRRAATTGLETESFAFKESPESYSPKPRRKA